MSKPMTDERMKHLRKFSKRKVATIAPDRLITELLDEIERLWKLTRCSKS
jgi:hypothetical protein